MKNKDKEWNKAALTDAVKNRKQSPVAPSIKEILIYKKYLVKAKDKKSNPKLLVLGATPELRDLGLKLGYEVVAVDANQKIIKEYNRLVTIKDRSKEIIKRSDWLRVSFPENYFTAVVGDAALNNISFVNQLLLLMKIEKWLTKGGFCILKQAVLPDDFSRINDFVKNIKYWRKRQMDWRAFHERYRFMNFYKATYNLKTKVNSGVKVFEQLTKSYRQGVLTKRELNHCLCFKNDISHTILKYSEFLKMFNKHFNFITTEQEFSDKLDFYPLKFFIGKK